MTTSWPLSRSQILDASGRPLLVPSVYFYAAGTTTPLDVFKDAGLTVPYAQPVKAEGNGRFPRIYIPTKLYAEEVRGPYDDLLWRDDGLGYVPPESTGNTGGGSVDPSAILTTGDIKWRIDPGIVPGWVRMNARTIGAANSGATELADLTTRPLYIYLWQTFPDTIAPVTGSRGTTAIADFTAGKPIGIPTMQGLVAAGLDDMGSSAANRLQVSANLSLTANSASATVDNAARVAIGMTIIAAGVPANTVVNGVNGTTVTMSNVAGTGSTGTVPARFSIFGDAQIPGQVGADSVEALTRSNLPVAMPGGSVTVSYPPHQYTKASGTTATQSGSGSTQLNILQGTITDSTVAPNAQSFDVANSNPGGGVPISTVQPSRLGTFYMKL